jgi:DnaJ-class molecular chaperone
MATQTHPASGRPKEAEAPTHYEMSQIPPVADADIQTAYHKAALLHHPDKRRREPRPQSGWYERR